MVVSRVLFLVVEISFRSVPTPHSDYLDDPDSILFLFDSKVYVGLIFSEGAVFCYYGGI